MHMWWCMQDFFVGIDVGFARLLKRKRGCVLKTEKGFAKSLPFLIHLNPYFYKQTTSDMAPAIGECENFAFDQAAL